MKNAREDSAPGRNKHILPCVTSIPRGAVRLNPGSADPVCLQPRGSGYPGKYCPVFLGVLKMAFKRHLLYAY